MQERDLKGGKPTRSQPRGHETLKTYGEGNRSIKSYDLWWPLHKMRY